MATVELTTENFDQVTQAEGIVLVDFWAEWCGPCHQFAPVFSRASEKYPDVVFGKVDTDAQPSLAMTYGIRAIPTLMAVRDGVIVFAQSGVLPESALDSLISQVRELDMEDVRDKLTTQSG